MTSRLSYILFLSITSFSLGLYADEKPIPLEEEVQELSSTTSMESNEALSKALTETLDTRSFSPFTGQISSSKVRMRIRPSLDSTILRELDRNELVLVTGETDDFFAIAPKSNAKAYIFRTFVLDGVIEGKNVNVRLEPSTDAPIISRLNTGDKVFGIVSESNNKWLEVRAPRETQFFVAKDYIKKIGGPEYLAELEERHEIITQQLATFQDNAKDEMNKPFQEMDILTIQEGLNSLVELCGNDFKAEARQAQVLIEDLQDRYLENKVTFLEAQTQYYSKMWEDNQESKSTEISLASSTPAQEESINFSGDARWGEAERTFFSTWSNSRSGASQDEFELDQSIQQKVLDGIIQIYTSPSSGAPGDYVVVNEETNVPIAFVYSTKLDLSKNIGERVSLVGNARPNNHYAFPAYHIEEIR